MNKKLIVTSIVILTLSFLLSCKKDKLNGIIKGNINKDGIPFSNCEIKLLKFYKGGGSDMVKNDYSDANGNYRIEFEDNYKDVNFYYLMYSKPAGYKSCLSSRYNVQDIKNNQELIKNISLYKAATFQLHVINSTPVNSNDHIDLRCHYNCIYDRNNEAYLPIIQFFGGQFLYGVQIDTLSEELIVEPYSTQRYDYFVTKNNTTTQTFDSIYIGAPGNYIDTVYY